MSRGVGMSMYVFVQPANCNSW